MIDYHSLGNWREGWFRRVGNEGRVSNRKVLKYIKYFADHFICCCSVAKLCLTLWSHGLHHARLPCPSLAPGVCSNLCPLNWCCLTILPSASHFSSYLQFFPASGSFPMSQFFTSSGQGIGASALASVFPVNIQGWFPLGLTGLICLLLKE